MLQLPRLTGAPSIYEFLRSHLDEVGRLPESHLSLPDEEPSTEGGIRFAPGAFDGAFGHHFGGGKAEDTASELAELVIRAVAKPSRRRLRVLIEAVSHQESALDYVDPLIERLSESGVDVDGLHALGAWLATTATNRHGAKLGLALLGVTGIRDQIGVVRTLGAHDEFTLYAAVAITNGTSSAESELWALAASVDGWGRIECVERLRDTTDPAIRSWILRTGFRNSIMTEYLAHIAATTGGLVEALRADDVDRELLTAAGEILEALIAGGPAEDIHDYDDALDAVDAYLGLMRRRAETLSDFITVSAINSLVQASDGRDAPDLGWPAAHRDRIALLCHEIMSDPAWLERARAGLESHDRGEAWRADRVARHLGQDTFEHHLARIRDDAIIGPWYDAWTQADHDRAETLVQLARDELPLDEIATGPADAPGMVLGPPAHQALDWTLQALRDHPGVGGDLLLIGLRSPVVRNRNMALNALQSWPSSRWPDGTLELLRATARSDPYEPTRALAAEILGKV